MRRTDRLPLAAPTDWETFEPLLRSRIDDSVAHLDVIADEDRAQLAVASRLTESLRLYDSSYHTDSTGGQAISRMSMASRKVHWSPRRKPNESTWAGHSR